MARLANQPDPPFGLALTKLRLGSWSDPAGPLARRKRLLLAEIVPGHGDGCSLLKRFNCQIKLQGYYLSCTGDQYMEWNHTCLEASRGDWIDKWSCREMGQFDCSAVQYAKMTRETRSCGTVYLTGGSISVVDTYLFICGIEFNLQHTCWFSRFWTAEVPGPIQGYFIGMTRMEK